MNPPVIEYELLVPLIALFGGALLGLLVEAFVPRAHRVITQLLLSSLAILVAGTATVLNWRSGAAQVAAEGALSLDTVTWVTWTMVLGFGLLCVLLVAEHRVSGNESAFAPMAAATPGSQAETRALVARQEHTEVFPLMLLSMTGMLVFAAANDLISLFVGLEVLSLPLYLLCGLARHRRLLSQEAALKYFLLGAMSSAIFVYGAALAYTFAGSFEFRDLDTSVASSVHSHGLIITAMALITVGLLFKVGAVPFHSWVPDVYTGAPTPVTAFMATCTKVVAVLALIRVLYVALAGLAWTWQPLIAVVAVASMLVGALFGLTQTDVKRMLAYSSIAHAGFILVGVAGAVTTLSNVPTGQPGSIGSALFYLLAYGFATIGAFGILMCVRGPAGEEAGLKAWAGLGRAHPLLGTAMSVFLLSMTGIPLTGGFVGKLLAFAAAWQGGYGWLVPVAVLLSLVTAAFYLRVVWQMFFASTRGEATAVRPSAGLLGVVVVCLLATLALGVLPGPVTDLLARAAVFLR